MEREKDRRDRCKCGRFFYWSTDSEKTTCPNCNTIYNVEFDYIRVYWLQEKIEVKQPFKTYPR
jgi:hypothetical protein